LVSTLLSQSVNKHQYAQSITAFFHSSNYGPSFCDWASISDPAYTIFLNQFTMDWVAYNNNSSRMEFQDQDASVVRFQGEACSRLANNWFLAVSSHGRKCYRTLWGLFYNSINLSHLHDLIISQRPCLLIHHIGDGGRISTYKFWWTQTFSSY
jgi:hypothetical protein